MRIGRINKFFDDRGYGFIQEIDGGSHFLHAAEVKSGTPTTGAYVRFESELRTTKGSAAINAIIYRTRDQMVRAEAAEALADSAVGGA